MIPQRVTPVNPPPQETRGLGREKSQCLVDFPITVSKQTPSAPKSTNVALSKGNTSWPKFTRSFTHSFSQQPLNTSYVRALDSRRELISEIIPRREGAVP